MLLLHVHYSPSAKDLPVNVHTFVDDFILTCNTVTGLNAKEFNSKIKTTKQVKFSKLKFMLLIYSNLYLYNLMLLKNYRSNSKEMVFNINYRNTMIVKKFEKCIIVNFYFV